MDDIYFMQEALQEAHKAYKILEVPIGCVIVLNKEIIARGFNKRNTKKNSLAHAEILAINDACNFINDWRLENCTMYVTVEPCAMCAGAIVQARVSKLVFGTKNKKAGSAGSILNILQEPKFNHQVECVSGILESECSLLMSNFFKHLRNNS